MALTDPLLNPTQLQRQYPLLRIKALPLLPKHPAGPPCYSHFRDRKAEAQCGGGGGLGSRLGRRPRVGWRGARCTAGLGARRAPGGVSPAALLPATASAHPPRSLLPRPPAPQLTRRPRLPCPPAAHTPTRALTCAWGQAQASPRSCPDVRRPRWLAVRTSAARLPRTRAPPPQPAAPPQSPQPRALGRSALVPHGRAPTHRLPARPDPGPGPWAAPAAPAASRGTADLGRCPPPVALSPARLPGAARRALAVVPGAARRGAPSRPHGGARAGAGWGRGQPRCAAQSLFSSWGFAHPAWLCPPSSGSRPSVQACVPGPPLQLVSHPCSWNPLGASHAVPHSVAAAELCTLPSPSPGKALEP